MHFCKKTCAVHWHNICEGLHRIQSEVSAEVTT